MSEKDTMINWLAKQDEALLSLASMYAKNQYTFGVNVTEKWQTAVQQHDALQRAYIKGRYDELKRIEAQRKTGHWVEIGDEPYDEWECDRCGFVIDGSGCIDPEEYRDIYIFCPHCGSMMLKEGDADD